MAQTSYADTMPEGFAGLKFDSSDDTIDSYANEDATLTRLGIMVAQGTKANQAIKLTGATNKLLGITIHDAAMDWDDTRVGYAPKAPMNVLTRGRAWVYIDQTVAVGDNVYVRHTANGGSTVIGAFRKTNDGAAEVHTLTPTAANSTVYSLKITVRGVQYSFQITSDGSATATEIADAFRAAMAANAAFTARVVASGTATLILTAQDTGEAISVISDGAGVIADVTTTAASTTATLVKGARFIRAGSSGGIAGVEYDLATNRGFTY